VVRCTRAEAAKPARRQGDGPCRVTVEVAICDTCGARSLDPSVDMIFDEAFQREYKKLK
jgi:hypothetical protein